MLDHSMVHELNLETEHAIVLTKMLRKWAHVPLYHKTFGYYLTESSRRVAQSGNFCDQSQYSEPPTSDHMLMDKSNASIVDLAQKSKRLLE
jgi:hypothetical protein